MQDFGAIVLKTAVMDQMKSIVKTSLWNNNSSDEMNCGQPGSTPKKRDGSKLAFHKWEATLVGETKLHELQLLYIFLTGKSRHFNLLIGIQAMALLDVTYTFRNKNFFSASLYGGFRGQFLHRLIFSGMPGNIYESALLAQALQEMKITQKGLVEFILKQQQEDGSFGSILATYLVLPVLAGRNFLEMNHHCGQRYNTGNRFRFYSCSNGILFLQNSITYRILSSSCKFGAFQYMLDCHRDNPVVYSTGFISNDAEMRMFWTFNLASDSSRAIDSIFSGIFCGERKESSRAKFDRGRPIPYSGIIYQEVDTSRW
ncbi:hypothetical protein HNY73_012386 [Argiope bruennichi]|uniref:Uncharacterized protein n=1 Tax=Argiope bruennichi TaxID=94029 RepID=A0A8T0EUT7_ARGBR|nr:hypothetical protein HNY73_012386 [Argiope bruennichi]